MVYSLGSFKAGHREESEIVGAQLGATQVHTKGKHRWSLASSIPSCPLDTLDMWAWLGPPLTVALWTETSTLPSVCLLSCS